MTGNIGELKHRPCPAMGWVFSSAWTISSVCPRQDSNLRTRLRRPTLYPLSYEGGVASAGAMRHAESTGRLWASH